MNLFRKKDLIAMKLNPSQMFSVFTVSLLYDVQKISEFITRNTRPIAYIISFDDYIKFLNLETLNKSNYDTFLATDKLLNSATLKVLPLINYLEKVDAENISDSNFSNIHLTVKEAIRTLYSNYLLNLTVLQIKFVEFIRWDNEHGDYVPIIIPSLGVFSKLKNMKDIVITYEDDVFTNIKYENYYEKIPSNFKIGILDKTALDNIIENLYPDIRLENFLYRGIHKHILPKGYYIEKEDRIKFKERVKAREKWETKLNKLKSDLDYNIKINNKDGLPHEEFLSSILEYVQECISKNETPKSSYYKIYVIHSELEKMMHAENLMIEKLKEEELEYKKQNKNPPKIRIKNNDIMDLSSILDYPERYSHLLQVPILLTDYENTLNYNLENLFSKSLWIENEDKLADSTSRWIDRHPDYTYYELIRKIESKLDSDIKLSALERNIYEIDDWVMLLASLEQICSDLYDSTDDVYLLNVETHSDIVHESIGMLKISAYHKTSIIP